MMLKKFLIVLCVLISGVAGFLLYFVGAYPNVPLPDFQSNNSEASVARGAYLANHVTVCIDCHSGRDWAYFSGPIAAGTEGRGGERFDQSLGFPGVFFSRNISSHKETGIGGWSDAEVARAITSGVSRTGHAFFPVMPYPAYAELSRDDLAALVAYIRTLRPVKYEVEPSRPDFPMNLILRTIPAPPRPTEVNRADKVAYGKYLTTIAACTECHTPAEKGQKIPGKFLAGGFEFPLPEGGTVRSVNITPDKETGIGNWTREQFIQKFKSYAGAEAAKIPVKPGEMNTFMPWTMYAGMSAEDLGAIYDYLRTVEPVKNPVTRFTAQASR